MKQPAGYLSKREQQIMELVYQREHLTAGEASELLPGAPSNSTVRTLLRILEEKGHLRHIEKDGRYTYVPVRPRQSAARSALDGVIKTFFRGSVGDVVATLLTEEGSKLSLDELDRLQSMIQEAREEGR
ncbi:BlaI/MecI/CopY family transcriptional regulator [Fimbriimonas ginsengisoli]|uniref:Transcriptional repressor, CopY family n=1 Tax=Fimbriimonas ginsengisoli Gsoil 348 TaxID=661478 RepID=A0A068NMK5_FIMGI|nr:BlaI/MecI/CopY family transcriptional regulator [Fimbriimonas ginsengisoli]AIE84803.1 transcriptional repressor, CopY family [Fimbriimonas ginsengisoli Gsoil 348]